MSASEFKQNGSLDPLQLHAFTEATRRILPSQTQPYHNISERDVHHLKVLKFAAAIAVISSKPTHLTARQFAEKLCNDYQKNQMMWKERYEATQLELFHTKQELLLSQSDQLSEQQIDIGIDDLYPTPPASGSTSNEVDITISCTSQEKRFQKHTVFLQSIIGLKSAEKCMTSPDLYDVIHPTVAHCLDIIENSVRNGDQTISQKYLEQSVKCITQLLSKANEKFSQAMMNKIRNIIIATVENIHLLKALDQSSQREKYKQLVLGFLQSSLLVEMLLDIGLVRLQECSNHLRNVINNSKAVDPSLLENVFYIFELFEKCLTLHGNYLKNEQPEILRHLHTKLEENLLHLSDRFPLFAYAVWKITGRIEILIF